MFIIVHRLRRYQPSHTTYDQEPSPPT